MGAFSLLFRGDKKRTVKERIIQTFSHVQDLEAINNCLDLLPLQFLDPELEQGYGQHCKKSFRSRLHLACALVTTCVALMWIIVGWGFTSDRNLVVPHPVGHSFHAMAGLIFFCGMCIGIIPHIPILRHHPEISCYTLIALMFLIYMSWATYVIRIIPLQFQVGEPVDMFNFFVVHQLVISYTRLKVWGDMFAFILYMCSSLGVNLFLSSRTKISWMINLWTYVVLNVVAGLQISRFMATFEFTITALMVALFHTSVLLLSFFGRCHKELQERIEYFHYMKTMQNLLDMRMEMENHRKQQGSTAIEDITTLIKKGKLLVETVENATKDPTLTEATYLINDALNVLTKTENLYSVKFSALEAKPEKQIMEIYQAFAQYPEFKEKRLKTKLSCDGGRRAERAMTLTDGSAVRREEVKPLVPMTLMQEVLVEHVGKNWSFDILILGNQTSNILLEVGCALLENKIEYLGIENHVLRNFLYATQQSYFDNSYHNATHAACVAHTSYTCARFLGFCDSDCFNDIDQTSFIVAAIGHDIAHPGRNNNFFINTYDQLAIIYNDSSVLENFHSALTFHIINQPECSLFSACSTDSLRTIRNRIVDLILATDMKTHFESLSRFRIRRTVEDFNYMNAPEDQAHVLRLCMKVGDLSHAAVDWESHLQWSYRVVNEFYEQGDQEESLCLAKSPLCDRSGHSGFAKSQKGFIQFVVEPLFKEIQEICPLPTFTEECISRITANALRWNDLAVAEEVLNIPEFRLEGINPLEKRPKIIIDMNDVCGSILRGNRQSESNGLNKEVSTQTDHRCNISSSSLSDESENVSSLHLPFLKKKGRRDFGSHSPTLRAKFAQYRESPIFNIGHAAQSTDVGFNKKCSGDLPRSSTKKKSMRNKVKTQIHRTLRVTKKKRFTSKVNEGSSEEDTPSLFHRASYDGTTPTAALCIEDEEEEGGSERVGRRRAKRSQLTTMLKKRRYVKIQDTPETVGSDDMASDGGGSCELTFDSVV